MSTLSAAGNQLVEQLSYRHGFTPDAVTHMLLAVHQGNGSMAQFSHPEFGGSGQWMSGGMLMLGDMFNSSLKYRVEGLCQDCASSLSQHQSGQLVGSFQSQSQSGGNDSQHQMAGGGMSQNSLFVPDPRSHWWPRELGQPSALGSQNNVRYAYFAGSRRLAVATGDDVWVYDTLDHQIGGFAQQQSGDSSITLTSQFGVVFLGQLPVVSRNGHPLNPVPDQEQPVTPLQSVPPVQATVSPTILSDALSFIPAKEPTDVFDKLERLGVLLEKGVLTQTEFEAKKVELLSRI
jgi:hypothetical protein